MKFPFRILTAGVLLGCLACPSNNANALDVSQTIPLERDTVLADGNIEVDDGYLLRNGKYQVITSLEEGLLGVPLETYEAVSGKPIMYEELFDDLKAKGVIPHWVRSRAAFSIGIIPSVIVSIAGQDPNPTITIAQQPTNQTVLAGGSAFFYVNASPVPYLSYQWLHNGSPLGGQTTSLLLLSNIVSKEAGNYSVTMTTGGKKVSSKKGILRVVLPVAIKTAPRSQTVKARHGAVFRVAVQGTPPFTYQWYYNSNSIPQATRSFYSILKVTESDAGSYAVVVSNGLSHAVSPAAMLTVDE